MRALSAAALVVVCVAGLVLADEGVSSRSSWQELTSTPDSGAAPQAAKNDSWLNRLTALSMADEKKETKVVQGEVAAPPPAGDGPPLPLHTIEGVGGALTVPMAYLVNPGPKGTQVGLPSVSFTTLHIGKKNLQSFAISETLFRRIELSYALNRFDTGTLGHAISKITGGAVDLGRRDVYLSHFNVRGLLLEENSFGLPLPAVVAGVQFKYNCGIRDMDNHTGGVLTSLGMERANGVDFTLHFSKMFPTLAFGRPLILTFGLRNSNASNIGYTGFGAKCETTVEADVACLVTDWLAVGYEFRQKNNPYLVAPGILGDEDDWHAIRMGVIINDHCTLAAAWGYLGPVGNTFANCAWGIQFKYEF